ncbi:MAG: hypothetical protein AUK54_01525 [Helicobacteraceae bacterium CG2_30_36_10]|nr:MAG: hypothetical protein AUK54_01525 [Helicobacteraceae bacterium CG2_30_36_10]
MKNNTLVYYKENANEFFLNTFDKDMSSVYERFLPLLLPHAKILDAGCGSGRDSAHFLACGFEVESFDASKEMCLLATNFLKKDVLCCDFTSFKTEKKYDAIWAAASLLHLKKSELAHAIRHLSTFLKESAYFYLSFKYGDREYTKENRHFSMFNEESFATLLQEIKNLKIVQLFQTEDVRKERAGEFWLNIILQKG